MLIILWKTSQIKWVHFTSSLTYSQENIIPDETSFRSREAVLFLLFHCFHWSEIGLQPCVISCKVNQLCVCIYRIVNTFKSPLQKYWQLVFLLIFFYLKNLATELQNFKNYVNLYAINIELIFRNKLGQRNMSTVSLKTGSNMIPFIKLKYVYTYLEIHTVGLSLGIEISVEISNYFLPCSFWYF